METLRFLHRFFHFSAQQWSEAWGNTEPDTESLKSIFRSPPFSRRALITGKEHSYEAAREEYEWIRATEDALGIKAVSCRCPGYPQAIKDHLSPERRPAVLYRRGADIKEEKQQVALVGTRAPSLFGSSAARDFSAYLSMLQIKVVSGLAKGIDTIAHKENLALGTVAILGSGVHDVYPKENSALAERIVEKGGTLLSPFPLGQVPLPQNFPLRNELIAAVSAGVVVVEGAESSGAAITGKLALAMGKTVVVLTQDYRTPFGRGAIRLQQAGATLVATEEEAMEAIYARFGGFGELPQAISHGKSFQFHDFLQAAKTGISEAIVLLEEGLASGQIEKIGHDRYRLRRPAAPDAKR